MESGLRKNDVIAQLTKSEHGTLTGYVPLAKKAAAEDPEFLAHLISWDRTHGQIKDTKVALPTISLSEKSLDGEFRENSYAHLLTLSPRELIRAVRFSRDDALKVGSSERKRITGVVEKYLRAREASPRWFEATCMQHRSTMKELYAFCRVKPGDYANRLLFKSEKVGVFRDIANLKNMPANEAATLIMKAKIPFLVVQGALGARLKEPEIVLAMLGMMSATEVVSNTKMLERYGIKTNPALRAAYEAALGKVATSKVATFKTTRAAEAMTDKGLQDKLRGVQEKQLQKLGGVEGDWLVLGDKSGSMQDAVEAARVLAGTLAKMVKGKVHLIFFNDTPQYVDVSGMDYDQILAKTKSVRANGQTSIGCGVQYVMDKKIHVDGIALVTDEGENSSPHFVTTYQKYAKLIDREPTVYLYKMGMSASTYLEAQMDNAGLDMQVFDLRKGFDFYSLPNLVQTMRVSRYSLVEEIMETPLLTMDKALKGENHGTARQAA